jgi:hypothetical protein
MFHKLLILVTVIFNLISYSNAQDFQLEEVVTQVQELTQEPEQLGRIETPACDKIQKVKKPKKFQTRLVLEMVMDPTAKSGISAIKDCYNSASSEYQSAQTEIFGKVFSGEWSTSEDFLGGMKGYRKNWTTEEKICFVSQYQDLIANYYEIDDLMGKNVSTEDMLTAVREDGGSAGVCVHIHRSGSEVGNALGLQCGTMAAIWETGDKETSDRGGHGVSVCQSGEGRYFLVNYGRSFEIQSNSYQEAIDASNLFLGPYSLNGVAMTCLDPEMKKFKNCNHIYTARDARWGLSLIEQGLNNLQNGDDLYVHLSNIQLGGGITAGEEKTIIKNNGQTVIKLNSGLVLIHETFKEGENHFTALGHGVTRTSDGPKQASELKVFVGGYHARAQNQLPDVYTDAENLSATGIMVYAQGETRYDLTPSTTFRLHGELAAGLTPKIGTVMDAGYAGLFKAEIDQKIGGNNSFFLSYEGGPTGSMQNNSLVLSDPHIQAGLRLRVGDEESVVSAQDEFTIHYLGKKSTALENEADVTVRVGEHFSLEGSSHLGQSYSDDPFYGNELYQRHGLEVQYNFRPVLVALEGYTTSGGQPAQYGEGILFENQALPQAIQPGYYMGVKLEGRF